MRGAGAGGDLLTEMGRRIDARAQLRTALDVFTEVGAQPWADRARQELRASGEAARKRDPSTSRQLTPPGTAGRLLGQPRALQR